jgi:hypothetical protein
MDEWSSEVIAPRILNFDDCWKWVITSVRDTFIAGTRRVGTNLTEDWADPWLLQSSSSLQPGHLASQPAPNRQTSAT